MSQPSDGQQAAPVRIQRKRVMGWRMPENTVCVDRTTGFGNPFPITKSSCNVKVSKPAWMVGTWSGPAIWFTDTRADAVALAVKAFGAWIEQPKQSTLREKARLVLRGKNLACWCPLDQSCHADVLLRIANAPLTCDGAQDAAAE